MDDSRRERSRNPDVMAGRRANLVVAPFLPKLAKWNLCAAYWPAQEASHLTSEGERRVLRSRRRDLIVEICGEFERFRDTVADEPGHARIADVDAAFRRLLRTLDY